jgi:hypothetical protein
MIWILLGIALLSGGGASSALSKQLGLDHKQASEVLKDSPQRKPALKALQAMQKLSQQSLGESKKLVSDAVKAGRDHSRPTRDIEPLIQPRLDKIARLDRDFLGQRDSLRAALTKEQWNQVFVPLKEEP